MRQILSIFFIVCFGSNLLAQNSDFVIIRDTIYFNIEGKIRQSLVVGDKYYCFFEKGTPYATLGVKKMYIIASDGTIEHCIDNYPDKINDLYSDFHRRNDSIVLKNYYDKSCYFFDQRKMKWEEIKTLDDKVYEDESFYVTSLDFGEWGGATWFREKKTGVEYRLGVITPIVNKVNDEYYLTESGIIYRVKPPYEMHKSSLTEYYEYTVKNKKYYDELYYMEGAEVVYNDGRNPYDRMYFSECPTYIKTSFVWDNKLYHLLVEDCNVYIAELKDGVLLKRKTIGKDLSVYSFGHSFRCPILKDGSQSLLFRTKKDKYSGLMHIKNDTIALHYFYNTFDERATPRGKEKVDIVFQQRFDNVLNNYSDKNIEDIIDYEKNINQAIDITPPSCSKDTLKACSMFRLIEDSVFTHEVSYHYSKKNNIPSRTYFTWKDYEFFRKEENNDHVKILYKKHFEKLKEYVTKTLTEKGILAKQIDQKEYDIEWKTTNGLTINLYAHGYDFGFSKEIRLFIEKK